MICVTRYNNDEFYVNCDLILTLEATPDTVVTMINGEKFMVKESVDELTQRIIAYKKRIFLGPAEKPTKKTSTSSTAKKTSASKAKSNTKKP